MHEPVDIDPEAFSQSTLDRQYPWTTITVSKYLSHEDCVVEYDRMSTEHARCRVKEIADALPQCMVWADQHRPSGTLRLGITKAENVEIESRYAFERANRAARRLFGKRTLPRLQKWPED